MAGRRYTQEEKDHALGALMASAVLTDGEWVANVRAVESSLGVPRTTLKRWWDGRDKSRDGPLRASVTRAADELQADGAKDWLRTQYAKAADILAMVLDRERYDAQTVEDASGRVVVVQPATGPDRAAKAMQITVDLLPRLDRLLHGEPETGDNMLGHIADRARRSGLLGDS